MKKLSALLVALVVCLTAFAACAEVDLLQTQQGLTFAAPAGWSEMELDEADYEQGYALMMVSQDETDVFVLTYSELDAYISAGEIVEIMSEDEDYTGVKVVTNSVGQEIAVYSYADQTVIGYMLCSNDGLLFDFCFLHADGSVLNGDAALVSMARDCMDVTLIDEAAAQPVEEEPAEVITLADGAVELEMVSIVEGPVFPAPINWTEQELSEADVSEGCLAAYADEASGRCMLVMASELGQCDNETLLGILQADEEYATAKLLTNEKGQETILYVTSDLAAGGYCFMGEDGWLYNFMFGLEDETNMTQDAVLAEMVSYCMNNTYFE